MNLISSFLYMIPKVNFVVHHKLISAKTLVLLRVSQREVAIVFLSQRIRSGLHFFCCLATNVIERHCFYLGISNAKSCWLLQRAASTQRLTNHSHCFRVRSRCRVSVDVIALHSLRAGVADKCERCRCLGNVRLCCQKLVVCVSFSMDFTSFFARFFMDSF